MIKFVRRALFFSLPLVAVAVCFEYLLSSIPTAYSYKSSYLKSNSDSIRILVLGNSEAYYGINPEYFTKNTFNAAHSSQTTDLDFYIFNELKGKLKNLETIIIPLSIGSLSRNYSHIHEKGRWKYYKKYYNSPIDISLSQSLELFSTKPEIQFKRFWSYYILKNDPYIGSDKGWYRTVNSKNTDFPGTLNENNIQAGRQNSFSDPFREIILKRNILLLREMAEWCEKNSVNLVLFIHPKHTILKTAQHAISVEQTNQAAREIIGNLSNAYYLFLYDDPAFTDADFYDKFHLNESGARKLSVFMSSMVDSLSSL